MIVYAALCITYTLSFRCLLFCAAYSILPSLKANHFKLTCEPLRSVTAYDVSTLSQRAINGETNGETGSARCSPAVRRSAQSLHTDTCAHQSRQKRAFQP